MYLKIVSKPLKNASIEQHRKAYYYKSMATQFPYCEICPIIENPSQKELAMRIYEGDHWLVTLRRHNQALLGTSFITLKEHRESLPDLTREQDEEFRVIRNGFIHAVGAAFRAESNLNLYCLMNYAFKSSNDDPNFVPQPHVHYHAKPRYSGPRTIGGVEFTDPEFGGPLELRRTQAVSLPIGKIIVADIKAHFSLAA